MSCKDCLNRREFLAKSALAAAALAVIEGCGDGQIGPTAVSGTIGGPVLVKIADYPGLANTGTVVQINGQLIGVVRTGASTFVASSMVCTHEGCPTLVESNQFFCNCHGSLFAANGDLLRGPATRALDHFTTSFDAATGTLTIS